MIEYRQGCLITALESGAVGVIAHQANCFNTMGTGLALALRKRWPEVYAVDCKTPKGDRRKFGGFSVARTLAGLVYNLYGQYNYGRKGIFTDYAALRSALSNMAHDLRHRGFIGVIGIPKLGCGVAGGDWDEVELIVSQTLYEWVVVVYEL